MKKEKSPRSTGTLAIVSQGRVQDAARKLFARLDLCVTKPSEIARCARGEIFACAQVKSKPYGLGEIKSTRRRSDFTRRKGGFS